MTEKGLGHPTVTGHTVGKKKTVSNLLNDYCEWIPTQAQITIVRCQNTSNKKIYEVVENRDRPHREATRHIKTKVHVSVFNKISLGFDSKYYSAQLLEKN